MSCSFAGICFTVLIFTIEGKCEFVFVFSGYGNHISSSLPFHEAVCVQIISNNYRVFVNRVNDSLVPFSQCACFGNV